MSVHARLSFVVHVWGQKKLKTFLINFLAISGNTKNFSLFKKKIKIPEGQGGSPNVVLLLKIEQKTQKKERKN